MSEQSDKMGAELAKVQQELEVQRKKLEGMQKQIADFLAARNESLQNHKPRTIRPCPKPPSRHF